MEEQVADTITKALRMATARQSRGRRRRAASIAGLFAGVAIVLTACGGSGAGSTPTGQGSPPSAAPASSQSGAVAFAQCVRSHGVPDFPDPQNGQFLISGSDQSNPNFQTAVQTCQHLLPGGSATNGGSGSNSSAELAFAHCMQTQRGPELP